MAPDMCLVCLDLNYDKFAATAGLHDEDQPLELSPLPHYRIVSRHQVAAAADGGCKLCSVLREGMLHFWGDQAPQHVDPRFHGMDFDDESNGEGNDGIKEAGRRRTRKKRKKEGRHGVDEDKIRRLHHNICIELRPERTLAPRLEFYVDAGKLFPGALSSNSNQDSNRRCLQRIEHLAHGQQGNPRPSICDAFGRAPGVTSDTDVKSAASILTRWLDGCKNHPACSGQPAKLPRRLLDLSRAGLPGLVETDTIETTSILPSYTTLSYCWGVPGRDAHPPRTTRDTYRSRTKGIEWAEPPTLFQDAILLTRALGCKFLWADSLCIIQDDEQDWIEQSATMADVYSLGYLTIAAVAATNPSASLFAERHAFVGDFYPRARESVPRVPAPDFGPMTTHAIEYPGPPSTTTPAPVHVRHSHSHIHGCVLASGGQRWSAATPLLVRAWALQERLLSRRVVFFTGSEMLWQCQEGFRCVCGDMDSFSAVLPRMHQASAEFKGTRPRNWESEGGSIGRIQHVLAQLARGRCSAQQARDVWPEVVRQYSNLTLTRESDRPYAIAGIARRIQEATGDTYLAGLWREDLPRGLLWVGLPLWSTEARRRPVIPSWSWMSRDAPEARGRPWMMNSCPDNFRADPRLRVVAEGTFCLKKKGDEFGAVVDGQVQLEAAMRHAVVTKSDSTIDGHFLLRFGDEDCDDLGQRVDLDCALDETEPVRHGDVVYCVLLGTGNSGEGQEPEEKSGQSLILREAEGRQGVYRHVGVSSHPPDLFAEAPVAVVTII